MAMTSEGWQRVKELFALARELAPEARNAFLDARSTDDRAVCDEVKALLERADDAGGFLETPPALDSLGHRLASTDETLAPGTRVGAFRIARLLGRGGMGDVYLALQEHPAREVALKVLRPGLLSALSRRRLEREAEVLAHLQHPGIAQIFEAGYATITASDGTPRGSEPYFAMELVLGESLTDFARAHALDLAQRLALFVQVCEAVEHAHQKGVVHRDLKPSNVLVDASGRAKVLDFGVARATGEDFAAALPHTRTGELVGTLAYMSPEQLSGKPFDVDTRSDVYSLGVVLCELLTGRLPHDVARLTLPEAARAICELEPRTPSAFDKSLRGDVDTIAAKALEKDSARRYRSPGDLAADVQRFLRDEPVAARAPSATYQLYKLARRHRGATLGLAAALVAALLGTGGIGWQVVRVVEARDRAVEAQSLAERRTADTRELALKLLSQLYDEIAEIPGSTRALESLALTAQDHLERLERDAGDDAVLLGEIGLAYQRLGDIQGNPSHAHLGQTERSSESYARALELAERVVELRPDDAASRARAGKLRAILGDAEGALGRVEEGLALVREGVSEIERALAADPSLTDLRSDLAVGWQRIGDAERGLGRLTDARTSLETSLAFFERVLAEKGGDADAREGIATTELLLGRTLFEGGELDLAQGCFERSARAIDELVAGDPENLYLLRHRANVLDARGDLELARGLPDGALEHYLGAEAIRRELCARDPASALARHDLAVSCTSIGNALMALVRPDEALERFHEKLALAIELAATDPGNATFATDAADAHGSVGWAESVLGWDASRALDERIEWLESASTSMARSRDLHIDLAQRGLVDAASAALTSKLAWIEDGLARASAAKTQLEARRP